MKLTPKINVDKVLDTAIRVGAVAWFYKTIFRPWH